MYSYGDSFSGIRENLYHNNSARCFRYIWYAEMTHWVMSRISCHICAIFNLVNIVLYEIILGNTRIICTELVFSLEQEGLYPYQFLDGDLRTRVRAFWVSGLQTLSFFFALQTRKEWTVHIAGLQCIASFPPQTFHSDLTMQQQHIDYCPIRLHTYF